MVAQDRFIADFRVTLTNVDDRETLWELVSKYHSLAILEDKVYLNKDFVTDLKLEKSIKLIPIKRNNCKHQYPMSFRYLIFRLKRMIETVGSQLLYQLISKMSWQKAYWDLWLGLKPDFYPIACVAS